MSDGNLKIYVTSYSEEVTGSNNHVKVDWADGRSVSFLVDCGLFQEAEHNHINVEKLPYKPQNILFAIATHVHTDHVGRFPYLYLNKFTGKIYCSNTTAELLPIVLNETAERAEDEYRLALKHYKEYKEHVKELKTAAKGRGKKDKPRHEKCTKTCKKTKKGKSSKKEEDKKQQVKPKKPVLMYTKDDVERVIKNVVVQTEFESFEPCEGIEITFYPNAHIAGAVLTVCRIYDVTEERYLLFTGDLGMCNPVTNVKTYIPRQIAEKIDIIIAESTYGSAENPRNFEKERQKHIDIINEVHKKKGTIFYMSNSLERPLRLGVDLKYMQEESCIQNEMKDFNIYFDSTFGIRCLKKYEKIYGKEYLPERFNTIDKDSRFAVMEAAGPKMIICTSPRFYYGSFINYGAPVLENPDVTLIFVAYVPDDVSNIISLPQGTKIDYKGEDVVLKCKRYQFGYYSSHISKEELDEFLKLFPNASTLLFNHGTHDSKNNYVHRYKTNSITTHNLLFGRTVLITKYGIEKYF